MKRLLFTLVVLFLIMPAARFPAYSAYRQEPSGEIAFLSMRDTESALRADLYIINADGTGLRRLMKNETWGGRASWSPDGEWLAFSSDFSVILIDPDDGTVQVVMPSDPPLIQACTPAWSPDSQQLALTWCGDYAKRPMGGYLVSVDGSEPRLLAPAAQGIVFSPTWSPDSTQIAYVEKMRPGEPDAIHIMRLGETDTSTYTLSEYSMVMGLAWSPDGSQIAVVLDGKIHMLDPNDLTMTALDLADYDLNSGIAWSPNGEQFAFSAYHEGKGKIHVADADGSDPRQLTDPPGYDFSPQWSSDGEWIVFDSVRDGNSDVYIVAVDRTEADSNPLRRLTTHEASDGSPIWRPVP